MEENRYKNSIVRVGDKSITRYSNALVRRAIEEITKVDCPIKEVKIGKQIWMAENLNVDHYRNSDPIPEVSDPDEWAKLTTGAWCYYDNDPENGKRYGKLYNWYAVNDPRGLAPEGWHIPTEVEIYKLQEAVDDNSNALKAVGQGIGDGAGTNTSGFSAMLSGYRGSNGYFNYLGFNTYFVSSTEVDYADAYFYSYMSMIKDDNIIYYDVDDDKVDGFSVRCVKDEDCAFQKTSDAEKIELNSEDAKAYFNRGLAKAKLEDYTGAIQDYNKAIEINPNYAEAYFYSGRAKGELEDHIGAIQDCNKAIELNPKHAEAYFYRGLEKSVFGR